MLLCPLLFPLFPYTTLFRSFYFPWITNDLTCVRIYSELIGTWSSTSTSALRTRCWVRCCHLRIGTSADMRAILLALRILMLWALIVSRTSIRFTVGVFWLFRSFVIKNKTGFSILIWDFHTYDFTIYVRLDLSEQVIWIHFLASLFYIVKFR